MGAFAGGGFSFGITNAQTAGDLAGISKTLSANLGVGPIQGSAQISKSSDGTFIASLSPGPAGVGVGIDASIYPTTTSAGNILFTTATPQSSEIETSPQQTPTGGSSGNSTPWK